MYRKRPQILATIRNLVLGHFTPACVTEVAKTLEASVVTSARALKHMAT
jgi:hypothetical protein